jgi:hypothetical protein
MNDHSFELINRIFLNLNNILFITMKTTRQIQLAFTALFLTAVLFQSCHKSETPQPVQTNNNSTNGWCGDTMICSFPFRITPFFVPSGYYNTGEQTTIFKLDSIDETPAYTGEGLRIVYTYHNNYWGAHFLNPSLSNPWAGKYYISNDAKKITFKVRTDYRANVTFNAFGDVQYGKVELYQKTPVTPVWESITIPLSGKPASFNAPLNIVIDFTNPPAPGTNIVVDIKDLQFE